MARGHDFAHAASSWIVVEVYYFLVYTECLAGLAWSSEDGSEVEIEDNDHFVIIASHNGLFSMCIFSQLCFPPSKDLNYSSILSVSRKRDEGSRTWCVCVCNF